MELEGVDSPVPRGLLDAMFEFGMERFREARTGRLVWMELEPSLKFKYLSSTRL